MSRPIRLLGFRVLLVLVPLLVPLVLIERVHELPPPVGITIRGVPHEVLPGVTLGQVIDGFDLGPTSGRLLDVEGKVIEHRADPGLVLLNGLSVPRSTELVDGDRIEVLEGQDRTEGTMRVRTRVKGRRPGNPQLNLGTQRVIRIATQGRLSGKVVSVRYRPFGKAKRPPEVALTFDDGPWPGSTTRVLNILRRMHAKATFFAVGYLAVRYPYLVRREIRLGMTVGNHSWSHPMSPPFADLRPSRTETELTRADKVLERMGVDPYLFRPPGGSYDGHTLQMAEALGMRVVNWDVDPHDYQAGATAESIARRVLSKVRPGSIVLLHDGGGDRSATIRALPRIIRGIRAMGLKLVAISR
ncbi:MAG: polysaccharide deacetylase family protein [Actinomycetota bacterium]